MTLRDLQVAALREPGFPAYVEMPSIISYLVSNGANFSDNL